MQSAQFSSYGGPEVLEIAEAPEPHPGPGQVRVVVHAAGINAYDWKVRAGLMAEMAPVRFPAIPGLEAAGSVDEIGAGVEGVALGDAVFGLGSATHAELAVLRTFVPKPQAVDWAVSGGLAVAAETASRVFELLGLQSGQTVLIDGAAGGVGSVAVQIAVARGATVVGTASRRNHDYLSGLGATPVEYGDGLAVRVRQAAPQGVDVVFDVAGKTPVAELTGLVADPRSVVSIANFGAPEAGARVTSGGEGDPLAALGEAAGLVQRGQLQVAVRAFPLTDIASAHELSQHGHARGKLVLVL